MSIVNDLQKLITRSRLFVDADKLELLSPSRGKKKAQMHRRKGTVKVGQGGTLDPLADGVLGEGVVVLPNFSLCTMNIFLHSVIGVGKGTKRLNEFLNCTKVSNKKNNNEHSDKMLIVFVFLFSFFEI
jgi:tRNA pseudouridine55 synthase